MYPEVRRQIALPTIDDVDNLILEHHPILGRFASGEPHWRNELISKRHQGLQCLHHLIDILALRLKRNLRIATALSASVQEFPNLGFNLIITQGFIHRAGPSVESTLPMPEQTFAIDLAVPLNKH